MAFKMKHLDFVLERYSKLRSWVVFKDVPFVILPSLISHGTSREVIWEGVHHLDKLLFSLVLDI